MRFISHYRNYLVGILGAVEEVLPGGLVRQVSPPYSAQFRQEGLTPEEYEFAEREFDRIPGRAQMPDEVTMVPINSRLSLYDTESPLEQQSYEEIDRMMEGRTHPTLARGETWGYGTMQRLTEQGLLASNGYGQSFLLFKVAPVPAPWPTYNEFAGSAEDLVEVLDAQGHDLASVLVFERQNLNRPEVIALIEERLAAVPQEQFVS